MICCCKLFEFKSSPHVTNYCYTIVVSLHMSMKHNILGTSHMGHAGFKGYEACHKTLLKLLALSDQSPKMCRILPFVIRISALPVTGLACCNFGIN